VSTTLGPVAVPRSANGTLFTQDTWIALSVDYDVVDELSLSLGYYNRASEIAPDGERRGLAGGDNIWWSPSARVFLSLTAHLDTLLDDAEHRRY
jgi:hypothetical protein